MSANRVFIRGLAQTLAEDATRADRLARDMINDEIPRVYAENANRAAYGIEKAIGYDTHSFDLYDQSTIRRLMGLTEHDQIIHEVIPVGPPRPELQSLRVNLDAVKDVEWNRKRFTSAITQSILQGESIPNVAKRLKTVLKMDEGMAVRAARTAMTSAENAGRVDSYKRAQRIGIKLEQQWMATIDERTRYSHRELDGQHVPVGAKFVVKSSGHELRFPGDPSAHPSESYCCRCTLVAWSPEIEAESASVERFTRLPKGTTYKEWVSGKKAENRKNVGRK
jgi:SPP1 gp7 family putative phage head morphogenesis protein